MDDRPRSALLLPLAGLALAIGLVFLAVQWIGAPRNHEAVAFAASLLDSRGRRVTNVVPGDATSLAIEIDCEAPAFLWAVAYGGDGTRRLLAERGQWIAKGVGPLPASLPWSELRPAPDGAVHLVLLASRLDPERDAVLSRLPARIEGDLDERREALSDAKRRLERDLGVEVQIEELRAGS